MVKISSTLRKLIFKSLIHDIRISVTKNMKAKRRHWVRPFNRERKTKGEFYQAVSLYCIN